MPVGDKMGLCSNHNKKNKFKQLEVMCYPIHTHTHTLYVWLTLIAPPVTYTVLAYLHFTHPSDVTINLSDYILSTQINKK